MLSARRNTNSVWQVKNICREMLVYAWRSDPHFEALQTQKENLWRRKKIDGLRLSMIRLGNATLFSWNLSKVALPSSLRTLLKILKFFLSFFFKFQIMTCCLKSTYSEILQLLKSSTKYDSQKASEPWQVYNSPMKGQQQTLENSTKKNYSIFKYEILDLYL